MRRIQPRFAERTLKTNLGNREHRNSGQDSNPLVFPECFLSILIVYMIEVKKIHWCIHIYTQAIFGSSHRFWIEVEDNRLSIVIVLLVHWQRAQFATVRLNCSYILFEGGGLRFGFSHANSAWTCLVSMSCRVTCIVNAPRSLHLHLYFSSRCNRSGRAYRNASGVLACRFDFS